VAFDVTSLLRALHIVAAALWVGAGFFLAFVLGPSLAKAGPAAGPFMSVVMRRGGLSPFFAITGTVTILAGGAVYKDIVLDGHGGPFADGYATAMTIGAVLAILALLDGIFALMPNERRIKAAFREMPANGPPPAELVARIQALGMKQGKGSAVSAGLLTLALLCMTFAKVL